MRLVSYLLTSLLATASVRAQDLTADFADDATEDTTGVFVQVEDFLPPPGGDRSIAWSFDEARLMMRPFHLDAGSARTELLRLDQVTVYGRGPLLEVYLENGLRVDLPASWTRGTLPAKVLVRALDSGDALLTLEAVGHNGSLLGGALLGKDEVLVRTGPAPGLAGQALTAYPFFQSPRAVNSNTPLETALDPVRHGARLGLSYDVYVVAHRRPDQWATDPGLVDVTGAVETGTLQGSSIASNVVTAWPAGLNGQGGLQLGREYDVVYDFGQDGRLDPGDLIDGFHYLEPGITVMPDTTARGPMATRSFQFDDPALFYTEGFDGGSTRSMRSRGVVVHPHPMPLGQLPLVTFSHGNTGVQSSYQGYDYLQQLLASYGFITASFDMFPAHVSLGIRWRGWLTNKNTERLILQTALVDNNGNPYPPMGGGVLDNRVDPGRIVTVGHSRGGEGVLLQYNQVANPNIPGIRPPNGTLMGLRKRSFQSIVTIAETVFLTAGQGSKSGNVPFLLLYGSSDADVCGCGPGAQPTMHYNWARGDKAMSYLYGAGHGYYNERWTCVCAGPFTMTRNEVEACAAGYLLPWVMAYVHDNRAALDYFTRSPNVFRPIGTEFIASNKKLVNLFRNAIGARDFVIEDYEANENDPFLSSSGQPVSLTVRGLFEGYLLDFDPEGGYSPAEPNGGFWWDTNGAIFHYNDLSLDYVWTIDPTERDLSDDQALSFVICQQSDHRHTRNLPGDRDFTITLVDGSGGQSSINTLVYGGIDEPYLREKGGWGSAFKTYRIDLTDFLADGSGLDLKDVKEVRFEFGSNHGSVMGRLGIDDLEIVRE